MKKLMITLFALFTFVSLLPVAYATTSEVVWSDYEKYRDIDPSSEGRKRFRERTFNTLEKHFAKLAESLSEGDVLKINVTDVDLAGDVRSGGINQLRVVKEIYFPRINFSYELVNTNGKTVTSGEVILKDMNFMMSGNLKYRSKPLGYEKKMLDDWFFETFKEFMIEQK